MALTASHATTLRKLTAKLTCDGRISQQEVEDLRRECLHWFASLRMRFSHMLEHGYA